MKCKHCGHEIVATTDIWRETHHPTEKYVHRDSIAKWCRRGCNCTNPEPEVKQG